MTTQSRTLHEPSAISSRPLRVLPGQYLFASSRISHCRHLLKPCAETNEAFEYLLAYCAHKRNMVIYAACMMSNHYHLVMSDPTGNHPKFFMDFNRMLAQFVKAKYGLRGNVFSPKPSRIVCLAPEAVADKVAYTLANPVSGGGVMNEKEWPGFRTRVDDMGRRILKARRPKHYFGSQKSLPDEVTLRLGFPPVLETRYGSQEAGRAVVTAALKKHTSAARAEMKRKGWRYLGKKGAMKVSHLKQARSWEVFDKINRRLATLGLSKEDANKAQAELKAWTDRYHATRLKFLEGERHILWPYGTWAMVQTFGMDHEAPPCVT